MNTVTSDFATRLASDNKLDVMGSAAIIFDRSAQIKSAATVRAKRSSLGREMRITLPPKEGSIAKRFALESMIVTNFGFKERAKAIKP